MVTGLNKAIMLRLLGVLVVVLGVVGLGAGLGRAEDTPTGTRAIAMWASPGCTCCEGWVAHMKKAGYVVTTHRTDDIMGIKAAHGVPDEVQSCHTAVIDGYVVEGHVPADLVLRMLTERPKARGIAAPGMPAGSPGMGEGPHEPYDIVLFGTPAGTIPYAQR